jgi:prenyltransferase beta subunit
MKRLSLALVLLLAGLTAVRAQAPAEKQATVAYLQKLQQPDGGFLPPAPKPGAPAQRPNLSATVSAVRALHYFGGEPRDQDAAARFVENAFDPAIGGFRNTPDEKPDVSITAVGLMGVAALKLPMDRYAGPALKFLDEHAKKFEDIRMAAAGGEAAGKRPAQADEWLRQLEKMKNCDGTYGSKDALGRDTGSAVAAWLRLGGKLDGEERETVLKALRASQRDDGAFGEGGKPGSDLGTTYRVMRSFHMLKATPDVAALRAFVAKCRNEDGGYGVRPGQPSSGSGCYYAGSVLHWLAEK